MVSTTTNNLNLISKNDFQDMGRFYPLFKTLFENDLYMELRLESKVVYTFFRDRLNLSLKNGWIDENGFVFLMYSNSKLAKMLNCSKSTLLKVKKELLKAWPNLPRLDNLTVQKGTFLTAFILEN